MYIMGALKVNESTAKKNLDDIKRHRSCYFFNGAEICVAAFRVIYDIGKDMLKSINNMLCAMESHPMRNSERRAPRTHSNLTNIKWWNIYYYLCRTLWSSKPAALRGRNKDPPIYLAASHSKKHVCRVYKEASHEKFVSTSVFYDMWKNMSSNQNSHPINDVCFKCE